MATAAVSGTTFLTAMRSATKALARTDKTLIHNERPSMTYGKLGRTNFMSSRLVFGCGAALIGGRSVRLLDRAFEAGINHYDVGSNIAYKGSEAALAPFLKEHRGQGLGRVQSACAGSCRIQ